MDPSQPKIPEREELVHLKDRALSAAAEGITIADARLPDRPLIYVNAGFERLTGYPAEAVLGRNCRFLQGADTNPATVARIRQAIDAAENCYEEILNYRRDGTPFWNRLSITPVRDEAGEVTHFIGIQSDVTSRRRAEEDLRRTRDELEEALAELRRDLDLAARVQGSLLPTEGPPVAGVGAAWEFRPSAHLAGDFLNVFGLDDRHVGAFVLDVSGHGAAAALLSVTLSRWLRPVPGQSCLWRPDEESGDLQITPPAEVARHLNGHFELDLRVSQYFTLVYGVLDVAAGTFRYVSAGHPGPIHVPARGAATVYGSTGKPIGLLPDVSFGETTVEVSPGDRIYLYTDGVTEARDASGEELGIDRLRAVLEDVRSEPLAPSLGAVLRRVEGWQGQPRGADDVSLLGLEVGAA